jgi:anhydro-N-acetylmuramic acid kinase
MQLLQNIINKPERLIIGLMSGTSADGIDAALIRLVQRGIDDVDVSLIAFKTMAYPEGMKPHILHISDPESGHVDEICRMNFVLGELFAQAAMSLAQTAGLDFSEIDLIGSHGQTIYHLPEPQELFGVTTGATLQIGDPSVIAQRTGVVTIGDFRPADIARGGQGAPLVPYVDYLLFRSEVKAMGLLNLGGIANITVLRAGSTPANVRAFDTGPANMIIDSITQSLLGQPMDQDGQVARTGTVSEALLSTVLSHPYFQEAPPKSTGRELFGQDFSQDMIEQGQQLGLSIADLLATATEFTARSVLDSYARFIKPTTALDELVISGGGAKNPFLHERLSQHFQPIPVVTSDERGVSSEAKEAIAFGILANQTINGRPGNLPGSTGADRMTVLGKIGIP